MRWSPRSLLVGCVVMLAVLAVIAPAVAGPVGASPAGTRDAPGAPSVTERTTTSATAGGAAALDAVGPAQTVNVVGITQEFAVLPDRPGQVRVTRRFDIPDTVERLETELPERASVTGMNGGFDGLGERRYEWDGVSSRPSISYRLAVNETGQVAGPEGAEGRYLFADVGEWGLFRRPQAPVDVTYRAGTAIEFDRQTTVDGPGVAGDWLIFVGDGRTVDRRAHGQTFRLVVPTAATLRESREEIFASVTDASDALRVGNRDEEVVMVAAPTSVDWAVEGIQTGESDFYVTADERVDDPNNVWLHEYVHTRQDFALSAETRWLAEASATYYAALLTLDQERIDFDEFRRVLDAGTDARYDSVVLADRNTWVRGANYRKGSLVVGELDRRLRETTDSRSDFQAVFRRLNERRTDLSAAGFVGMVGAVGTDAVADDAERYTETSAGPAMWDASAHRDAFGDLPPRIAVSLPESVEGAEYRVSGPYRNRTLDDPPLALVTGETLTLDVHLANDGGRVGEYNLSYGFEDGDLAARTGSIDAGDSTTETVAVTADEAGERSLRVGEYTVPVTVVEPAPLEPTALRANRSEVQVGGTVGVEVDLRNSLDRPGRREVVVTVDGDPAATRVVHLDAGASRTVRVPIRLQTAGSHEISVANGSVTVEATDGTLGGVGPGVGAVGALGAILVLVAAVLGLARRR